jgi:uncharacterized integral membrane protein
MTDTYPETPDTPPLPIPSPERSADVPKPTVERVFVGTGLFWGLIVGIVLAVAVIVLAAQNTDRAAIAFLGWDFSTPLIAMILASLVVGVIFDELFGLVYRARRRKTLSDRATQQNQTIRVHHRVNSSGHWARIHSHASHPQNQALIGTPCSHSE